jgi:outer membrane scaffolding protein for murein synthesis (MipA/OmpV family)
MNRRRAVVVLALFAAAVPAARADRLPLWEAGAGAYAFSLPDYRGSDQSRGYLYPLPYFRYRGRLLEVGGRKGLASLLVFERRRAELDLSLNASQPAPSERSDARRGMPDLAPTLEIGPVLRAGWRFGIQAGPLFNDRRYNAYYYQVDPQYATPQRSAYAARAGYGGTQLTASLTRRYKSVWVNAFVRAYDLHGAVFEDSPLVKRSYAVLAGVGFAYVFAQSTTRVEAKD